LLFTFWYNRRRFRSDIFHSDRLLEANIPAQDTGDAGLDLVGKVPFDDKLVPCLLVFAQCGCGKNWKTKLREAHPLLWKHYIHFKVPPSNMATIPYCYRGAGGKWDNDLDIVECILIDRLRLTRLLGTRLRLLTRLYPFDDLVDYVLSYDEPLT
jgi:hypothetical protein